MPSPAPQPAAPAPAAPKRKSNLTLDILRWLTDAGIEAVPSSFFREEAPAISCLTSVFAVRHIKFGTLTGWSFTSQGKATGSAVVRWLTSAPVPAKVCYVTSNVYAYVEVGDLLVVLDGSVEDQPMDKRTWTVSVYGMPTSMLVQEDWLRSFPKKKASPKKPVVHFLNQNADGSIGTVEADIKSKLTKDEIALLYGEGIQDFHQDVLTRLTRERSGIAILHGPPGGGKTSYIRYLVSCLMAKKRVILVPKSVVDVISTPKFTSFLLGLRNEPSILVIEDAEEAVAASSRANNPATSTLLNMSDGILNDVAGVQVVVTFNCPIGSVDPALLRSGRLIGMREFGPLSAADARRLADAKKLDASRITGPTMLCDVLCAPSAGSKHAHKPAGFR